MLEVGHLPPLWLAPSVHLGIQEDEDIQQKALWWDLQGWQEVSEEDAEDGIPRPARELEMNMGLLNLVEDPTEPLPEHGETRPYSSKSSGVYSVLQVLACQHNDGLWGRRRYGPASQWTRCPYDISGILEGSQAFEMAAGERYVFVFNTGQVSEVVMFDASRNVWQWPVGPTRPNLQGHAGVAPQPWRPVTKPPPADNKPLKGWLLEATGDSLMLMAPVSRDGRQRGLQDPHVAVHFLGSEGQVVSHQIACSAYQLTVQRYGCYILFVKDANHQSHAIYRDGALNDDFDEEAAHVVAWLLSALDVSLPPLPVLLPAVGTGFDRESSVWSLVMYKNRFLEDLSASGSESDGLRLHLAELQKVRTEGEGEEGAEEVFDSLVVRLWVSRQIDIGVNDVHFEHSFDGNRFVRHALSFTAVCQQDIQTSQALPMSLWSTDLCHIMRVTPEHKLSVWQCPAWDSSRLIPASTTQMTEQTHAVQTVSSMSGVNSHALPNGWGRCTAPAQATSLVTGIPCYPAARWGESSFERPEDLWLHPIGRDAGQHAPLSVLYP
mmetsp:Transcript_5419/g.13139  ORF Transcript_5419/g.13139 Transcript_5419/m.13139 type:complete len:549 (-) Transcript_5419:117-1763(-)